MSHRELREPEAAEQGRSRVPRRRLALLCRRLLLLLVVVVHAEAGFFQGEERENPDVKVNLSNKADLVVDHVRIVNVFFQIKSALSYCTNDPSTLPSRIKMLLLCPGTGVQF